MKIKISTSPLFTKILGFVYLVFFYLVFLAQILNFESYLISTLCITISLFFVFKIVKYLLSYRSVYYFPNEKLIKIGKNKISLDKVKSYEESILIKDIIVYEYSGKLKKARYTPKVKFPSLFGRSQEVLEYKRFKKEIRDNLKNRQG